MSDPFLILEAEHDSALEELDRLEQAALELCRDAASTEARATVGHVLEVLRTEIRRHNEMEERALFPLLRDDAPTAAFEEEHRSLWALERELGELVACNGTGDRIASVSLAIAELLRGHIERENAMLFPMARAWLGEEGLWELTRRMG
jgi:hemerythrin-like domain-containing protein